ncbi:MAG: hypothetical protein V2A73_05595, partial [Pseudomonadota bacterium]
MTAVVASVSRARRPFVLAVLAALVLLGMASQIAQGVVGRELLVAFHGNEVSLGAFFAGWLAWVAVGSLLGRLLIRRNDGEMRLALRLATCLVVLPAAMMAQVLAARFLHGFLAVPVASLVSLDRLLFATMAVTAPTSLIIGSAFPLACAALRSEAGATRLYVAEAIGALAGGLLLTFLLLPFLGAWRSIGVVGMLAGLVAYAMALPGVACRLPVVAAACHPPRGAGEEGRSQRIAGVVVATAFAALALSPLGRVVGTTTERTRFSLVHPELDLVKTAETKGGHVAVGRLGAQYSLIHDGSIGDSFPDRENAALLAAYLVAQAERPRRVLLLGGVAAGVLDELLRYEPDSIDVVEIDADAFAAYQSFLPEETRAALRDPRVKLRFGDARRFVNSLERARSRASKSLETTSYDLVAVLTPEPESAQHSRTYTLEFYEKTRAIMDSTGVLCTRVSSAANYLGRKVAGYGGAIHRTLRAVFPRVVVTPGDDHLMCATGGDGPVLDDGVALADRYRTLVLGTTTGVDGESAHQQAISRVLRELLPSEGTAYVAERLLAEKGPVNSDLMPVAYYHNMLLLGELSSSRLSFVLEGLMRIGEWWILAPWLVLLVLVTGRIVLSSRATAEKRASAAWVLAVGLGFVAMAAQLTLMLAYQATVGHVYGRIALLGGAFMLGLALGGGLGFRLASRAALVVPALLLAVAGALLSLPPAFEATALLTAGQAELTFFLLCGGMGVLTGIGFPMAMTWACGDNAGVGRASALLMAADHWGGALGGLIG